MSKVPYDSSVAPVADHVEGESSKLFANASVMYALLWKSIFKNVVFASLYYPVFISVFSKSLSFTNGVMDVISRVNPINKIKKLINTS